MLRWQLGEESARKTAYAAPCSAMALAAVVVQWCLFSCNRGGLNNKVARVQKKADRIIQNYCMSDMGVTLFAKPQFVGNEFREGKEDVSESFMERWVATTSVGDTYVPSVWAMGKLEVRLAVPSCAIVTRW